MSAVRGHDKLPLAARLDTVRLRHALHAVLAHPDAARQQLFPHPGPAVFLVGPSVNRADVRQQRLIAHTPTAELGGWVAGGAASVLEEPAGAHAQYVAYPRDRPHHDVLGDPGVPHSKPFAKYAVAFLIFRAPSSPVPAHREAVPTPSARHSLAARQPLAAHPSRPAEPSCSRSALARPERAPSPTPLDRP